MTDFFTGISNYLLEVGSISTLGRKGEKNIALVAFPLRFVLCREISQRKGKKGKGDRKRERKRGETMGREKENQVKR